MLMLDNKCKIFVWLLYLLHASNKSKFSMIDVSQSTTTLNASVRVCSLILVYSWLSIQCGMRAKVDARSIHKQTKWRHEIREVFNLFNHSNIIRGVQVFGFCTACIASEHGTQKIISGNSVLAAVFPESPSNVIRNQCTENMVFQNRNRQGKNRRSVCRLDRQVTVSGSGFVPALTGAL